MRFVIPAMLFSLLFMITCAASAAGAEKHTQTITTLSGICYENAVVERVGVVGIDISYINSDGAFCLKGIPFTDLPAEIQRKYNYNPDAAREYQQKVSDYQKSTAEKGIDAERQRLEKLAASLRSDFKGGREINDKDLSFVIQGFRRLVEVDAVANTRSGGTLVKVNREQGGDGMQPLEKYIIIDGVKLQPGVGGWSGFIYPTGLKAKAQGRDNVPVYCDSLDDALKLVNRYFEIYSSFAASGSAAGNAEVPDQTAENTAQTATDSTVVINYYDDDDDGYYMGGTYWPVWWWNNNRPPRPPHHPPKPGFRPPRPPHHPPKPGHHPEKPVIRPPEKPANVSGGISGAAKPSSGKNHHQVKTISGSRNPVKVVKTPQTVTKVNSHGHPVPVERCGNFSRVNVPAVRGGGLRGGRR